MIDLAVERREWAGVLQRDPIMLRCLQEHARFRHVMERVNRALIGGAPDPRTRVLAATLAATIGGAVIHPLVAGLDDETLRAELWRTFRRCCRTADRRVDRPHDRRLAAGAIRDCRCRSGGTLWGWEATELIVVDGITARRRGRISKPPAGIEPATLLITNSDQGETPQHQEDLSSQKTEDPD